jgi:ABC-type branched-subunit amino acid transport system substrate-binding protein
LALQVAGRTATPVVTLCPDASVTGAGIPWMVRIVPQDTDEAQALFRGFHNKTNQPPWRWLPVIPGDRAGRESKRDLTLAARQVGAQLEAPLEVLPATTNFAELARRALALKPEGIVLWLAPAQAGRLARALRSGGYAGVLAGPARLGGKEFATEAGVALEGFITTGTVQDQEGEALRERFQAAYRGAFWVDADWTAMAAYDAARLLVEVIRKVGEGPLHRAFPPDKPMAGVSGRLQFDQYGRRVSELCLMEWRQGRLQVLVSQGRQDRRSSL